eukprot:349912-Chlamydomonas_euryale.AAC.15
MLWAAHLWPQQRVQQAVFNLPLLVIVASEHAPVHRTLVARREDLQSVHVVCGRCDEDVRKVWEKVIVCGGGGGIVRLSITMWHVLAGVDGS